MSRMESSIKGIQTNNPVIICVKEVGYICFSAKKMTTQVLKKMFRMGGGTLKVVLDEKRTAELYGELIEQMALPTVLLKGQIEESLNGKAATIRALVDENKRLNDFRIPGEISQVVAKKEGVLARLAIMEAASDLVLISIGDANAVFIEIHDETGNIANLEFIQQLAEKENVAIISIHDILEYRKSQEHLVHEAVDAKLSTKYGDFHVIVYNDDIEHKEHLVISKGDNRGKENVLVRLHSECFTGDVLGSKKCDCGEQLQMALRLIEEKGEGLVIYLRQEGRGIGLINKLKTYNLQAEGYDTVEANHQLGFADDLRDYAVAAQILKDLEIKTIDLLTNNPAKISGIEKYGISVLKRMEIEVPANHENKRYLQTKKEKMGHILIQDFE